MPKSVRSTSSSSAEKVDKPPPQRSMKWRWRSEDELFGVLMIRDKGEEFDYLIQQVGKNIFLVTKLVANSTVCYVVNIGAENPNCGCLGFEEHGRCKHVAALSTKREMGEV